MSPGDAGGGDFDTGRSPDAIRDGVEEEEEDDPRENRAEKSNAADRPARCEFFRVEVRKIVPERPPSLSHLPSSRRRTRAAPAARPGPRTGSARKRKGRGPDAPVPSTGGGSGPGKRRRTSAVAFSVPTVKAGGGGWHLCLVEGVGGPRAGGTTTAPAVPRRGRLLELPGGAAPGRWDAVLRPAGGPGGFPPHSAAGGDFRISLRHESAASAGPLEAEAGEDGGVLVSAVRPAIHRASHFGRQGVISPEEAGGAGEGGGDAALRLGCISLAAFAGFDCSSSVLHSKGTSGGILGRCEPAVTDGGPDQLLKILGDEGEGVLYPCSMAFDSEYTVLLCHDRDQNIVGIDGESVRAAVMCRFFILC